MQVKENQKGLLKKCQQLTNSYNPKDQSQSREKGRGRRETRVITVFQFPKYLQAKLGSVWEEYIKVVIKIERKRKVFNTKEKEWKSCTEYSYYISTVLFSAKKFNHIIRDHWGIENRNHYVRDVTLEEDASRIRKNPGIFVKLRSFALNILRHNGVKNVSNTLYSNSLDINQVLNYEGF